MSTTPQQHAETLRQIITLTTSRVFIDALDKGAEALSRTCATCQWANGEFERSCTEPEMVAAGPSSVYYYPPPQPFSCSRHTAKE